MRARRRTLGVLFGVLLGLGSFVQACSTSSGGAGAGGCEADPNACGAGTTCWPKECTCPAGQPCGSANCTPRLACLPSTSGKSVHDSCNNSIGKPTCSDHQACVEFASGFGGCLQYCNDSQPSRGCAAGETCVDLRVGQTATSPVIHVCAVVQPDAGTPEGGTGGDADTPDVGIADVNTERPM